MAGADTKVIQLLVTTTTTGIWFEATVPDGLGGHVSRRITYETIAEAIGTAQSHNKGYYATEAALVAAHPVAEAGDYAIVGFTDTVWLWDTGTLAWVDTTSSGAVVSVNGLTGAVTLTAVNISFASTQGIAATNVGAALDELKVAIDAGAAPTGGIQINYVRAANGEAVVAGTQTILFSSPLVSAAYTVMIQDDDGVGVELVQGSETVNGFDVVSLGSGNISYQAISDDVYAISGMEVTDTQVSLQTPNSASTPYKNGSISFDLDETGHNLKVRVKYSDGTTKTATIALV